MKDNTTIETNPEVPSTNGQIVMVIYNISRNLTRKHLQEIFNNYGNAKGVYIPKEEETKLNKNYAFVEYEKQTEAEKASLYMSGGQIDGLIIRTEMLNPNYYHQKKKAKSRSRSRDKDLTNKNNNKADGNNKNNSHSKNCLSSNSHKRENINDIPQRRRYHHRKSPKSPRSKSSSHKDK